MVGSGAATVAHTRADVVLAIGLFLGPPAAAWCIAVVRELVRLHRFVGAHRHDTRCMHEEGYPPGPPVEFEEQTTD